MRSDSIAFVAANQSEAQAALTYFTSKYGLTDPKEANIIVALGGDGLMLETLHKYMALRN